MRKGAAEPCWRVRKLGFGLGPPRGLCQRAGDEAALRCWSPLSTLHLRELTGGLAGGPGRAGAPEAHRCGERCPELSVSGRLGADPGHSWALCSFMCVCRQAVPRPCGVAGGGRGEADLDPGAWCPVQASCSPCTSGPVSCSLSFLQVCSSAVLRKTLLKLLIYFSVSPADGVCLGARNHVLFLSVFPQPAQGLAQSGFSIPAGRVGGVGGWAEGGEKGVTTSVDALSEGTLRIWGYEWVRRPQHRR